MSLKNIFVGKGAKMIKSRLTVFLSLLMFGLATSALAQEKHLIIDLPLLDLPISDPAFSKTRDAIGIKKYVYFFNPSLTVQDDDIRVVLNGGVGQGIDR